MNKRINQKGGNKQNNRKQYYMGLIYSRFYWYLNMLVVNYKSEL